MKRPIISSIRLLSFPFFPQILKKNPYNCWVVVKRSLLFWKGWKVKKEKRGTQLVLGWSDFFLEFSLLLHWNSTFLLLISTTLPSSLFQRPAASENNHPPATTIIASHPSTFSFSPSLQQLTLPQPKLNIHRGSALHHHIPPPWTLL